VRVRDLAALLSFPLVAQVTSERIRNSEREPANWLTYSGNYRGYRYSPLAQINTLNVASLKPVWMYQINDLHQFEPTPLVVDGVVYIFEPPRNAPALAARTRRPL
jgi:glucose dehydrogenase